MLTKKPCGTELQALLQPTRFTIGIIQYVYMHTNIPNMTLFPIFWAFFLKSIFHLTYEGYAEVTYIKLVRF